MAEQRVGFSWQWIELDRKALASNVRRFRELAGPKRLLLAVVKANAYGHGIVETSGLALAAGIDWFGVHSVEEGLVLHAAGVEVPVLVLGPAASERFEEAVACGLRFTLYDRVAAEGLSKAAVRLRTRARVHLKLETGTNRQGLGLSELASFARTLSRLPGIEVEGLSSHFANVEDTTSLEYARRQTSQFTEGLALLRRAGIRIPVRHIAATAAAIVYPESRYGMVRLGIGLYGLWPSKETYLSCRLRSRTPITLRPVLAWRARIAQVKRIPKGAFVGYGCTFKATRSMKLAVVPVGYADGYDRGLSNTAHVLVRGKRAAVRGRIAMNFFTADVTDIPGTSAGDVVTLIGRDGRETISAESLAGLAGTIHYEILARLSPAIPRRVV
ncbi:MAG: alanine racemase, partial [Candidatus Aminicenantes bacterium]|nr:alanine racemase [Candidatus Aminicenantes bacterium]